MPRRRSRSLAAAAAAAAAALLASVLAGCPFDARTDPREQLAEAVRGFNEGVHWGNLEAASRWVVPAARAAWTVAAERVAKDVSYSFYEVKGVDLKDKAHEAAVRVEIGWFHKAALIEKRTTVLQRWIRLKGTWLLVGTDVVDGPPIGG
ncbi:MAG TPA: hypothetical protein VG389_21225 [Myxococcota bacterium]|jgi:hypothetical protein|nr:hypothetical protein [Myxococcota bacterium]